MITLLQHLQEIWSTGGLKKMEKSMKNEWRSWLSKQTNLKSMVRL